MSLSPPATPTPFYTTNRDTPWGFYMPSLGLPHKWLRHVAHKCCKFFVDYTVSPNGWCSISYLGTTSVSISASPDKRISGSTKAENMFLRVFSSFPHHIRQHLSGLNRQVWLSCLSHTQGGQNRWWCNQYCWCLLTYRREFPKLTPPSNNNMFCGIAVAANAMCK